MCTREIHRACSRCARFVDTCAPVQVGAPFDVRLVARRSSRYLAVPPLVDCGSVLVNTAASAVFPIVNNGPTPVRARFVLAVRPCVHVAALCLLFGTVVCLIGCVPYTCRPSM